MPTDVSIARTSQVMAWALAAAFGVIVIAPLPATRASVQARDPLPSWNSGPSKQAIIAFVDKVTTAGSADFVPPAERIAVFDNDGTLWPEAPMP